MNKTGMLAWAYFFPERKLYRQHARFIAARKQKKPPRRWLTQQLPIYIPNRMENPQTGLREHSIALLSMRCQIG